MDFGYMKFKAQNGKSGIFWEPEKKKSDRKFGYQRKDQRFTIRKNPQNYEESDPEVQDEDQAPKPNFIERNRQLAAGKNKGRKPTLRPVKQPPGTMTLTQEQLNAILASVGKVASGEEDNLRISIDAKKNAITIESPRKSRDSDYYDHHSAESGYDDDDYRYGNKKDKNTKKSPPKHEQHTKEEETTIFDLLEEFKPEMKKPSSKKDQKEDKNKKKERKKIEGGDDENDNYFDKDYRIQGKIRKEDSSRERKRDTERVIIVSNNRDKDRENEKSTKRNRSRSRDRNRRQRRHDSGNENSDREISQERRSRKDREDEVYENRKNKVKDREHYDNKSGNNNVGEKQEKMEKALTPRELAGIPMSLPWKHMTLGERRRLMQARIEAEAAIKEVERKKLELKDNKKESKEKERKEEVLRERKERERKDRESEQKNRERKDKENERRDRDRERERKERESEWKEREKERIKRDSRDRADDQDIYEDRSSRRKKKHSRERRRQYSSDEDDSDLEDYHHRDRRKKKDSRSHRRSPSPEPVKHRSRHRTPPDERSRGDRKQRKEDKSPERTESKLPTGLPPTAPKSLTFAEKKKLQWEKERVELAKQYDPWGKPGAGAPIRTKSGSVAADYKTRQEETLRASMDEIDRRQIEQKEALIREMGRTQHEPHPPASQHNVPHAMRSSFMFGQAAPDADQIENTKELERRKWLEDLDKQNEEKRGRQLNEKSRNPTYETWADKYSKPTTLPDQFREPPTGHHDPISPRDKTLDGGRVSSAPTYVPDSEDKTYLRGQNVFIDPVTKQEMEDKRKRLLEHQQAIMEQVQHKQREKQREREEKMKEDMEEEMKLQAERDRIQRQFEQEQNRIKMKEARRQHEADQLKQAMDEAQESALREKITKRMQHLEKGGHDTSHLKANLQDNPQSSRYQATEREGFRDHPSTVGGLAKLTPRNNNPSTYIHAQPDYIPGLNLELSPRVVGPTHRSHREAPIMDNAQYTENRVLTPSQLRHHNHVSREFGTQTGMGHYSDLVSDDVIGHNKNDNVDLGKNLDLATQREESDVRIMYNTQGKKVRVKSASKEETTYKYQRKPQPPAEKISKAKLIEEKEKPTWNFQNKKRKKPVKQSEKDLNFKVKKKESEIRRQRREQELMNLVDMNRDRIPTERLKGGNSRGQSPVSDREGHRSRSNERYNASRRSKSHSPENFSGRHQNTYRMASPNLTHRSTSPALITSMTNTARGRSPPVPALRYKKDNAYDVQLANKQLTRKYADSDPLHIPVVDGEFVPFMRTVEVLDPAHAGSPLPISREATAVVNARKAYLKGMKPGDFGKKVNPYDDRLKVYGEEKTKKDPIMNPALVTEHPTYRQDAILQQLSSLKMNLIQKQRELETFSPTDFEQ